MGKRRLPAGPPVEDAPVTDEELEQAIDDDDLDDGAVGLGFSMSVRLKSTAALLDGVAEAAAEPEPKRRGRWRRAARRRKS